MHGTIFVELQKFVETKVGEGVWLKLLERAGLEGRTYDPFGEYPDAEVGSLVATASQMTGMEASQILEAFGTFIAPDLLALYWGVVKPEWRTLDVIEHTEREIHSVVRLQNPNATPPYLKSTRLGPNEVLVDYSSPRKLCFVAKGICTGLASHYGESISIREPSCMHRGDDRCLMYVSLNP